MYSIIKINKINFLSNAFLVFSALFGCVSAFAIATVDPAFNAVPSKAITAAGSFNQLVQPDGKIVMWGTDYVVDGLAKGQIVRLNPDGTVDNTFSYCGCLLTGVTNVGLQPDGKLLVAGSTGQSRMVRLNPDGSQDLTFGAYYSLGVASNFEFVAIQPDNKIFVTAYGSAGNGFHAGYLVRLNADGTVDTGFTQIIYDNGRTIYGYVRGLVLAPSTKFYLAVTTFSSMQSSSSLRRFNADGTVDSSWEQPNFTAGSGFPNTVDIQGLGLQSDGALVVGGKFDTVNGVAKKDFVRLLTAGNVDLSFTPPVLGSGGGQLKVLSNGKILVGFNSTGNGLLARLNSDGSLDNTFALSSSVNVLLNRFSLDASERIVFLGISNTLVYRFFRLNPNGDVDASFNPNVTLFGQITTVASQPNGKTIVAGTFTQMSGLTRAGIARVNADGTPDATFDPGAGFSSTPSSILVQGDGKILVSGSFSSYNGTARTGIVRLNTNGSLDTGFNPVVTNVAGISLQADGKVLIGGSFTTVNSIAKERLARLNSDGTLDVSFGAQIASGTVYTMVQQTDGKFIVGGSFTGVDGFNRSNFVRLNSNGSLDQTLNAGSPSTINEILIQPDGKYLCIVGAGFPTGIARRNVDGTNDAGFTAPQFLWFGSTSDTNVYSIVLQSDGSMIVGGKFSTVAGVARNNLVRLRSNGFVDTVFFPNGSNGTVRDLALQTDGNVIVAGDFVRIATSARAGIARIVPGLYFGPAYFDYDGDGKSDVSVFRASENQWYILRSSDFGVTQAIFAIPNDVAVPADFDGDAKTDVAIWRPSNGDWWSLSTINNQQANFRWGQAGDIPMPSDFDGDGKADYIVFRPSTNEWLRASSANASTSNRTFGLAGDKPLIGDFDGDGKSDVAIFRPSDGNWWWWSSLDGIQRATRWGIATDIPVPSDYDGDGKTDFCVYRPSTGVWYIINSSTGAFTILPFGLAEDKPVSADYDGDGKADIAVFRPSTGIWYLLRSTAGFAGLQFGISTDVPTQNSFLR